MPDAHYPGSPRPGCAHIGGLILGILLIVLAIILNDCAGPAGASILAPAASSSPPIHTCIPRKIIYFGEYRYDNDLFATAPAQSSCITVSPALHSLTVDKCYRPGGGTVVAYPKIYIGQNYTSGDPESGLPVLDTRAQRYVLHLTATGTASCPGSNYIQDSDTWFSTSAATADQHGSAELVIALRWHHSYSEHFSVVSIAHHWYRLYLWRDPIPGSITKHWSIALLLALGPQPSSRTIRIATVLWHLRKIGWLPSTQWQDSTAMGIECWQGCRGLSVGMVSSR
jgi:hypothetical protein